MTDFNGRIKSVEELCQKQRNEIVELNTKMTDHVFMIYKKYFELDIFSNQFLDDREGSNSRMNGKDAVFWYN